MRVYTHVCGHIACVHALVSVSYEYTMGVLYAHVCECRHIHASVKERVGAPQAGLPGSPASFPALIPCLLPPSVSLSPYHSLLPSFQGGPAEWDLITVHSRDPLILLAPRSRPLGGGSPCCTLSWPGGTTARLMGSQAGPQQVN